MNFFKVDEAAALRDSLEQMRQSAYETDASFNRQFHDLANEDIHHLMMRAYGRGWRSSSVAIKMIDDANPATLNAAITWLNHYSGRQDAMSRLGLDWGRAYGHWLSYPTCDVLADSIINLKQGSQAIQGKTWLLLCRHSFEMCVFASVLPITGNAMFNAIICENADIFSIKQTQHESSVLPPMKIETTGPPICQPTYCTPLFKHSVIDTCIDDMLAQGIIRHSVSPWAGPLVTYSHRVS